jgi:copper(I)-binding protein
MTWGDSRVPNTESNVKILRMTGAALAAVLLTGPVLADDVTLGDIKIEHPWARATAASGQTGVVYLKLENDGTVPDRLVAAASPAADTVELHTNLMENGMMMMREVKAIDLGPDAPVVLAPDGLHIMLIGLKEPLVKGKRFPLTLTFEKAGSVTVEVAIQGAGAAAPE